MRKWAALTLRKVCTFCPRKFAESFCTAYLSKPKVKKVQKRLIFETSLMSFPGICVWILKAFFDCSKIRKVFFGGANLNYPICPQQRSKLAFPNSQPTFILTFFVRPGIKVPDSNCPCKVHYNWCSTEGWLVKKEVLPYWIMERFFNLSRTY